MADSLMFSCTLHQLHVFAWSFDWFSGLSGSFMIESWLTHSCFPALCISYMFLLGALTGSLDCLGPFMVDQIDCLGFGFMIYTQMKSSSVSCIIYFFMEFNLI